MLRCLGHHSSKKAKSSPLIQKQEDDEEPYYSSLHTPAPRRLKRSIGYSNLRKKINEHDKSEIETTYIEEKTLLLSPDKTIEIPRRVESSPAYETISDVIKPFERLTVDECNNNNECLTQKLSKARPISEYEIPRSAALNRLPAIMRRARSSEVLPSCIYTFDMQPGISGMEPKRRLYYKKSEMPPKRRHVSFSELKSTKFDRKSRLPAFRKKTVTSDDLISHIRSCQGITWRKSTIKMSTEVIV